MYQVMLILQLMLRKIIKIVIPISRVPDFAALRGNRPIVGIYICTKNDNVNISSNVNLTSNVNENNKDSDYYSTVGRLGCPSG